MFKKMKWHGTDPIRNITSNTEILPNVYISFMIKKCADDNLRLIDNTTSNSIAYVVKSVEAGKEMAESLYTNYCEKILKNIME